MFIRSYTTLCLVLSYIIITLTSTVVVRTPYDHKVVASSPAPTKDKQMYDKPVKRPLQSLTKYNKFRG